MAEIVKKRKKQAEGEERTGTKGSAPSFLQKVYDILEVGLVINILLGNFIF